MISFIKNIIQKKRFIDKSYNDFTNYLLNNFNDDELSFIKSNGKDYVSDLFLLYMSDRTELSSKIYFDLKNS